MSKSMSMEVEGLKDTLQMLENLSNNSDLFKPVVYVGAEVVADELRKNIGSLKTQPKGHMTKEQKKKPRYPYDYEKNVLLTAMGVAPIKNRDVINTKVGFDGYYENKSGDKRPVPLLANSINAGTTFLKKQNFIDKTARTCREKVAQVMKEKTDKIIEKIS